MYTGACSDFVCGQLIPVFFFDFGRGNALMVFHRKACPSSDKLVNEKKLLCSGYTPFGV